MVSIKIDASDHDRKEALRLKRIGEGFIPLFRSVHAYMTGQTNATFLALAHGGTFRGVTWPPFRTATVARGGTHWSRATSAFGYSSGGRSGASSWGVSSARRKVRNRMPAAQASLLQDIGNLMKNALTYTEVSPRDLIMGSKVEYAPKQQAMRKFVFFETPRDTKEISTMAAKYLLTGKAV